VSGIRKVESQISSLIRKGATMKNAILPLLFVTLWCGCGSAGDGSKATLAREALTAEEIAKTGAVNAYEAIRSRRPEFLMPRAPRSFGYGARSTTVPVVYLDAMYYGELEVLKSIPVQRIKEIRYIDPRDATIKYGTGHVAGVILVISKTD
jgi:hypothetical protein